MAGPGIRYHYMAEELSKYFSVTVGFFDPSYLPNEEFSHSYTAKHIDAYSFEPGFKGYDAVIALWLSDAMMAYCNQHQIFVVFDVYAPVPVENLASALYSGKKLLPEHDYEYERSLAMYRKFFANGDLFLFSNRRQLDFWTGYVFGADQVRISTYDKRPFFDRFIYAPMGIDTGTALKQTKQVMRGVLPGVDADSKILLWTGGIWGWYDGQVLVKAMKRLEIKRPDIKLVFFGTKHPNPSIPEMQESLKTRTLADKNGLIGKSIFFQDGWVPYPERINYLSEADVAVNTHKASIETEFSHRTRVLDHILAGLPTIGTAGDYLSDEVVAPKDIGLVVPDNDARALEQAIIAALEPKNYAQMKQNIMSIRSEYDWQATLQPLVAALQAAMPKLNRLPAKDVQLSSNRALRFAKKATPLFAKKIIIRALKYVN